MKQDCKTSNAKASISSELIVCAKSGDQEAFTALYEQTFAGLYQAICAVAKDEDTAWDILQESYLRAFRNLDKLDANEAFLS